MRPSSIGAAVGIILACLLVGCNPFLPVAELGDSEIAEARRLAAEVSEPGLREYLSHFASPRCAYLSADGVADAEAYIQASVMAAGYAEADIVLAPVTIRGMTVADAADADGGISVEGPFTMNNVIVTKRGSDPSLAPVLVGAHYDTVANGPGVNDNGSGCAAVLEAARILADETFPRSVVMVFFAFEEPGMLGSSSYVSGLADGDLPSAAFILDSIGVTTAREKPFPLIGLPGRGDFVAALSFASRGSLRLVDTFLSVNEALEQDLPAVGLNADAGASSSFVTSSINRSDHIAFAKRGVDVVHVTDTCEFRDGISYYHLTSDTEANIDYVFLTKVVAATVASVAVAANR